MARTSRGISRARVPKPATPGSAQQLAIALREAGIEAAPAAFVGLVRDALASVRSQPRVDPRHQLSAADAEALQRGGFDLRPMSARGLSPLAETVAAHVAMLDGALSVPQAAKRLGVDQSRIRQLLGRGDLYGVKVHGEWRLPTFQFTRRGTVPGIQQALRELPGDLHPVEVLRWLGRPDPDLELEHRPVSPLDWLSSGGDPARVSALARDL
jgi:uncharacterized protein